MLSLGCCGVVWDTIAQPSVEYARQTVFAVLIQVEQWNFLELILDSGKLFD